MSRFSYEKVDQLMEKLHDFSVLLESRRGRISGKFDSDLTKTIKIDGKDELIYDLVDKKLRDILELKKELPHEANDLLLMTFGENTRFKEWMDQQKKSRRYNDIESIHQELIRPIPTRPTESTIAAFMDFHRNAYLSLQKIILYLNRIEQSARTGERLKLMVKDQKTMILHLAALLKRLELEKLDQSPQTFIESLTTLFREDKFRGFFDYAQKFHFDDIRTACNARDPRFHWHFPDKFDLNDLNSCLVQADLSAHYIPRSRTPKSAITALLSNDELRQLLISYKENHNGQGFMRSKLSSKKFNPHQFLINLDTEFPCNGLGKVPDRTDLTYDAFTAYRAGLIEEALIHLDPAFNRTDSGFIRGGIPPEVLGMGDNRILDPLAFNGKWLLTHMHDSLVWLILAAISPVTPKSADAKYSPNDFSPTDKLKAYALLIQAIDEKKISIADIDVSVLEQKRLIAERALYIIVKYKIPNTNEDFIAIKDSIESGTGVRAAKAAVKLFSRKHAMRVEEKTIQKLFREYASTSPAEITLDDLAHRIPDQTSYPIKVDVAVSRGARVVYARDGAGAGAGAGGSEMEGPSAGGGASAGPLDYLSDSEDPTPKAHEGAPAGLSDALSSAGSATGRLDTGSGFSPVSTPLDVSSDSRPGTPEVAVGPGEMTAGGGSAGPLGTPVTPSIEGIPEPASSMPSGGASAGALDTDRSALLRSITSFNSGALKRRSVGDTALPDKEKLSNSEQAQKNAATNSGGSASKPDGGAEAKGRPGGSIGDIMSDRVLQEKFIDRLRRSGSTSSEESRFSSDGESPRPTTPGKK